jgi:shikimate kinase
VLPRNIALIGYRGTGKSTAARLLALRLGWDWVDADVEVELHVGKSIAAIFAEEGELAFRDREAEVVAELCRRDAAVLALGGGAVLREANREAVASCGAVVWLHASVDAIAERLAADCTTVERRPDLTPQGGREEIERLLEARAPIYRACATLKVDTDRKTPAAIVEEIVAALGAT